MRSFVRSLVSSFIVIALINLTGCATAPKPRTAVKEGNYRFIWEIRRLQPAGQGGLLTVSPITNMEWVSGDMIDPDELQLVMKLYGVKTPEELAGIQLASDQSSVEGGTIVVRRLVDEAKTRK